MRLDLPALLREAGEALQLDFVEKHWPLCHSVRARFLTALSSFFDNGSKPRASSSVLAWARQACQRFGFDSAK